MQKAVLRVEWSNEKERKKALKIVSAFEGIQSVAVDMDNRKVTVIGSMDPVQLAEHLRKRFDTVIEYVGPKETPTTQVTGTGESNDNTPTNPDSEGKTYVYYPNYPPYPPPYCYPPPCYHFHH